MANTLKIKRGTAATIPNGALAEPLFTSDTYDLYIGKGDGTNQRFQKYIASGTSSQFLKGDGSLDSNTYQTALTFTSPLVNTSGTISIPAATSSVNGYLTSTDWTTFNSKEPAITAGTTLQYYRGDKTFQTLDTAAVSSVWKVLSNQCACWWCNLSRDLERKHKHAYTRKRYGYKRILLR